MTQIEIDYKFVQKTIANPNNELTHILGLENLLSNFERKYWTHALGFMFAIYIWVDLRTLKDKLK